MGFVVIVLKSKPGVQDSDIVGIGQLVGLYQLFKTSNIILVQQLTLPKPIIQKNLASESQCLVALLSSSNASNNYFVTVIILF
jgi:hypothetical protein